RWNGPCPCPDPLPTAASAGPVRGGHDRVFLPRRTVAVPAGPPPHLPRHRSRRLASTRRAAGDVVDGGADRGGADPSVDPAVPLADGAHGHPGADHTSVMVWGQHFAEALLKPRLGEESRPRQVRRIQLLSAGVLVTILGMLPSWPWVVVLGALMVSAALVWYAAALGVQVRAALAPRFEFTVKAYIAAACLLPLGATLGALMAFSP